MAGQKYRLIHQGHMVRPDQEACPERSVCASLAVKIKPGMSSSADPIAMQSR
jgi:hypothetical protein